MDMGFEPTAGATPATGGRIRGKRATTHVSGSGTSGGGVSGGGTPGGGTSGGGVSGGARLTLNDMYKMQGQPPPERIRQVAPTASPHKIHQPHNQLLGRYYMEPWGREQAGVACQVAKEVHQHVTSWQDKYSLPQASKHIKEHN